MIRTQISFDKSLYRRARAAAKLMGISLAEYCRRALEQDLTQRYPEEKKKDDPWSALKGIVSGQANSSQNENIDEIVYGKKQK